MSSSMADRWYFAQGNNKHGPFSAAELKRFADSGQLRPTDMVWKEGVASGVMAGLVKNLFAPTPQHDPAEETSQEAQAPAQSGSVGDSESVLSRASGERPLPEAESPPEESEEENSDASA